MTIARGSNDQERAELLEWLNENNDYIVKSPRFDQLIDNACMFFYKKRANQVSEDTLNFIRRSANELLRNKASKDAMKKRLTLEDDDANIDKVIRDNDTIPRDFEVISTESNVVPNATPDSDDDYIIDKKVVTSSVSKRRRNNDSDEDYVDKRMKHLPM